MNSIAWSVSNHRHPASGNKTNHESMNPRSEEHTSELQSLRHLVCRLLLEKKKKTKKRKKNKKKIKNENEDKREWTRTTKSRRKHKPRDKTTSVEYNRQKRNTIKTK